MGNVAQRRLKCPVSQNNGTKETMGVTDGGTFFVLGMQTPHLGAVGFFRCYGSLWAELLHFLTIWKI